MERRRSRSSRSSRRERGVALVEFSFVFLLLFGLFAAVIDFGFGWRRSNETATTLRSGARVAANLGDNPEADLQTLRALNAGIAEIGPGNIERVIIYKSPGGGGEPPANCLAVSPTTSGAGVDDQCNVYGQEQLASLDPSHFASGCSGSGIWDRFYCPTEREADQGDGADWVGIYIEVRFDWVVGVLPGDGTVIEDHVVMRLEPQL